MILHFKLPYSLFPIWCCRINFLKILLWSDFLVTNNLSYSLMPYNRLLYQPNLKFPSIIWIWMINIELFLPFCLCAFLSSWKTKYDFKIFFYFSRQFMFENKQKDIHFSPVYLDYYNHACINFQYSLCSISLN